MFATRSWCFEHHYVTSVQNTGPKWMMSAACRAAHNWRLLKLLRPVINHVHKLIKHICSFVKPMRKECQIAFGCSQNVLINQLQIRSVLSDALEHDQSFQGKQRTEQSFLATFFVPQLFCQNNVYNFLGDASPRRNVKIGLRSWCIKSLWQKWSHSIQQILDPPWFPVAKQFKLRLTGKKRDKQGYLQSSASDRSSSYWQSNNPYLGKERQAGILWQVGRWQAGRWLVRQVQLKVGRWVSPNIPQVSRLTTAHVTFHRHPSLRQCAECDTPVYWLAHPSPESQTFQSALRNHTDTTVRCFKLSQQ